jgi:hypothetical protein
MKEGGKKSLIEVILNERRADASPSESLVPLSDLESLAKKKAT